MNLKRALTHLAHVGITADVLRAGSVDPTDPTAVRREVETLIASAVAEDAITDMHGLAALQMALGELLTDAERADKGALAKALHTALSTVGVLVPRHPEPRERFDCLADY